MINHIKTQGALRVIDTAQINQLRESAPIIVAQEFHHRLNMAGIDFQRQLTETDKMTGQLVAKAGLNMSSEGFQLIHISP